MKKMFDKIFKTCHCERSEAIQNNKMDCHVASAPRNDNKVDSPLTTHNSLVKAIAFTLAETLVVMGIIGVVAALTIPNLNQSTGDREKVAKLKKVYANLTDAFGRATAVYGNQDEWCTNLPQGTTCAERVADRLKEFMKISKDCGNNEGCFSTSPLLMLDGSQYAQDYAEDLTRSGAEMFILADGTSVAIVAGFAGSTSVSYNIHIYVDIDGPTKGKMQEGVDKFSFYILEDGIYPVGGGDCFDDGLSGGWFDTYDTFPAMWVIQNGNLDYLKCADDLDWDSKTSCK